MNRRDMMGYGVGAAAAVASMGFGVTSAFAQTDSTKLPILAGGDFATASSKLALKRGNSALVTSFAEFEITEQAAVAKAFGSTPGAAGVTQKHAALLQELQAASGAEFDMLYVEGQILGHQELLTLHRSYSRRGDDPMAMGASLVAVPSIMTHLALLKTIRQSAA